MHCGQNHEPEETVRSWIDIVNNICPTCYGQIISPEKFDSIKTYFEPEFKTVY